MDTTAGRLLRLLSLMQSRPTWTADELAERLGITPRTVRRDITRLRELGYPVEAAPGRFGGYQLGAGGALPPLLLSDDEAVAVAIGLRAAAGGGVTGIEDAALAALAKLEQVLPAQLRDRLSALHAATLPIAGATPAAVTSDVLVTVAQGCRRLERIRFNYVGADGQPSERRVEPFRLVAANRRWYLVGFDLDRQSWRTFRVDRMAGVRLTGHRFVRADEPDAEAMVAEGLAVAAYPVQARVHLDVPPREAAAAIPRTVGSLEPDGEGTLLRIGAMEVEWLARYLAGLTFPYHVIDPPELKAALRSLGRQLVRDHR
jgi:predicted DNA-binding transcriptional regulator YafY